MHRSFLRWAAIFGALAVGLGAYGAHKLKEVASANTADIFETAVRYQFIHALALLIVSSLFKKLPGRWLYWSAVFFIAGIILFSGSLYIMTLQRLESESAVSPIMILTPVGGVFLMAGWLCLLGAAGQKY